MGHLAASGGYYISCGADRIYADETTLTGSIGIFGVIPCIKNLLTNNLGITQGTVSTNTNSDFISLSEPMTPSQRNKMQRMINNGYETFVGRCANGRGMSIESIKAIAEGRVWDGKSALDLGLVDKIGGIDTAISDLASELGFDNYAIVEYPSETNDLLEKLLNAEKISEGLVSDKLGYSYEYYNAVNKIKELEKIQCRMEKIIIE
jgi:protease-4